MLLERCGGDDLMEEKISNEKIPERPKGTKELFHEFKKSQPLSMKRKDIFIFVGVVIAGVITGYFLSQGGSPLGGTTTSNSGSSASTVSKGTIVGSSDLSTFKDTATGVLTKGGIDGEGQYHLVRPGGDSQNVYLTSSIVDLSQFIGKKVKVNGQTQTAQKAGWLMDVGRVEVLE